MTGWFLKSESDPAHWVLEGFIWTPSLQVPIIAEKSLSGSGHDKTEKTHQYQRGCTPISRWVGMGESRRNQLRSGNGLDPEDTTLSTVHHQLVTARLLMHCDLWAIHLIFPPNVNLPSNALLDFFCSCFGQRLELLLVKMENPPRNYGAKCQPPSL